MSDYINKRFVHLTHDATGKTLFNDGLVVSAENYFVLTGSTAEEATFVQATLTSNETYNGLRGYTVIPTTAVVFVDFPDGTTGIISHMKFYSKLDELGGETRRRRSMASGCWTATKTFRILLTRTLA